MITTTDYFNKKALQAAALHSASGAVDGPLSPGLLTVGLFKNNLVPDNRTVQGDLTEADFDGYAAVSPLTFLTIYQGGDGAFNLDSNLVQFLQTGVVITNTVFGYYVATSAGGGNLLLLELFETPIQMGAVDRAINLAVNVQIGPASVLGAGILVG